MAQNFYHFHLIEHARRHDLKILGHGRVGKRNIDRYKWLVCQAADQLRGLPLGEVITVEGSLIDSFIVVRSLETKSPTRCARCQDWNFVTHLPGDEYQVASHTGHLIPADDLRRVTK